MADAVHPTRLAVAGADTVDTTGAAVLCASADLSECGLAHVFSVRLDAEELPAFALRFQGRVVAYLNRCAHVPVEMDWQPGQFLDQEKRWIICSIHGAAYEPADGRCVAGPCRGRRLTPLRVQEQDGQVFWWPHSVLLNMARPESQPIPMPAPPAS